EKERKKLSDKLGRDSRLYEVESPGNPPFWHAIPVGSVLLYRILNRWVCFSCFGSVMQTFSMFVRCSRWFFVFQNSFAPERDWSLAPVMVQLRQVLSLFQFLLLVF